MRVFVSYRQSDGRTVADAVVAALTSAGHEVFRDDDPQTGIKLGDDLVRELYDELERADVVVSVVSPELHQSQWCFAELMAARGLGKRIIPIVTERGATHPLIAPTVLAAAVDAGGPDRAIDRLCRELAGWEPGGEPRWDWKRGPPYPGLRGFGEDDQAVFFGRDDDVRRLRDRLELPRARRRLVCLAGASGSGKSSLIRAGLLAALARDPGWRAAPVVTIEHGSPTEAAAVALEQVAGDIDADSELAAPAIAERWTREGAPVLVRRLMRRAVAGQRLLLCFDQFEQLLVAVTARERERLWSALLAVIEAPLTPVHALVATRIDYLDRLFELGVAEDDVLLLGPLRGARMRTAITGPARAAGLTIADELVDRMVTDADGPDGLPLLSAVLHELTAGLGEGQTIDAARYQGVAGVLGRLADAAIAELDVPRDAALAALMRLVSVDATGTVVRRRVPAAHLDEPTRAVLRAFADHRLVVIDRDAYDVAHEALFRAWPPLADAIHAATDRLQLETELAAVAERWIESGRPDDDYLWGGARLARAVAWLAGAGDAPDAIRDFVEVSRRQDQAAGRALASNIAMRVETELGSDPERALAVLLEAQRRHGWSPALLRVMRELVTRARVLARIRPDGYDEPEALSVDLSPDGNLVACLFEARTRMHRPGPARKWRGPLGPAVRIAGVYELAAQRWLWQRPVDDAERSRIVVFGDMVALSGEGGLSLADTRTGADRSVPAPSADQLRLVEDMFETVDQLRAVDRESIDENLVKSSREVALAHSGALVAAAAGGAIEIFDRTSRAPHVIPHDVLRSYSTAGAHAASKAPPWIRAGAHVVTGGELHVDDGELRAGPGWPGPDASVFANGEGPIHVHGPAGVVELPVVPGVSQAALGPGGDRLFVRRDNQLETWDVATGRPGDPLDVPPNGPPVLGGMVVSPDGRYLATPFVQGDDVRTFVYDLNDGSLLNARGRICAFSPDASRLVSCLGDTAYLFRSEGLADRTVLFASYGPIFDLAFSPSGTLVAAALGSGGLMVFDLDTRERIAEYPQAHAICVTFGDTEQRLVAGCLIGNQRPGTRPQAGANLLEIELLAPDALRARAEKFVHLTLTDVERRRYDL